ncbi:MAG: hypothetical protein HQ503_03910, partial [Rhodospirillales bacterium]|nr:hypothetical protein [Rhodospirillales bacterium]
RPQQIAGVVLIAVGLIGALISGEWWEVFVIGIAKSRTFLLLFFAISWLQFPVGLSPSMRAARGAIMNQPPIRRFLVLSSGVHVMGSILNVAGLGLLTPVIERETDPALRKRLALSLMHGFTAASCWSPFYIGMIVVLVAVPSLKWGDVAPKGALMAVILILFFWVYDRVVFGAGAEPQPLPADEIASPRVLRRTASVLALLIALVMIPVQFLDAHIPIALGIVGPPFAMIWLAAIEQRRVQRIAGTFAFTRKVVSLFPTLRNETLVFAAANVFGAGVASVIPSGDLSAFVNSILPWPDAKIAAMLFLFPLCGLMGMHPVIVVIFLSSVLPPELIGLPDWIVGLVYLCTWGICTMVSPFSGTTLFMSRASGVPSHVIGWRWSPPSVFAGITVIAIYLIALRHITL